MTAAAVPEADQPEEFAKCDKDSLTLIQAMEFTRVKTAIEGAAVAVKHFNSAMAQMTADANVLTQVVESLECQNQQGNNPSPRLVPRRLDEADDKWNKLYFLAKQFQKEGILIELKSEDACLIRRNEPQIMAAHYGGKDITDVAKHLFVNGEMLEISKKRISAIGDPWVGNEKSLVIIYKHEEQIRVLKTQDIKEETTMIRVKPGTLSDLVQAAPIIKGPPDSRINIHAVVWGLKLISNEEVYQGLYEGAKKGNWVSFSNDAMCIDGWKGIKKSGIVAYTVNDKAMSVNGYEHSSYPFQY
ncbi:hypothetical protein ABW20_dc0106625 [Dactylellina cionopaga]|nr:hypothetical protein ABW20_dc0106625 [Dactylellina cionopaga]